MVSAGYSGFEASPDRGLFVCSKLCCLEPQPHARTRSLGRLLGRAAVGAEYERIKRMGSSTNEARCLAWLSVKIKADGELENELVSEMENNSRKELGRPASETQATLTNG